MTAATKWYPDNSTYSSNTYSVRSECAKNSPTCVTHFSTFLNVAQGKTTKRFWREFLMKIAYYCYVEGARRKEDITKEIVNRAQKYLGATEYNISTILKTQLRGDCLRLPPEVVKKFQLLFKALWPTFSTLKSSLDANRSNMVNFNYISRVLCRLLGYDVLLNLFDVFRMKRNLVKHSAFMRRMFKELGWCWDGISEIPDHVLDEYEAREGVGGSLGDLESLHVGDVGWSRRRRRPQRVAYQPVPFEWPQTAGRRHEIAGIRCGVPRPFAGEDGELRPRSVSHRAR